jgi:hypothetical protein
MGSKGFVLKGGSIGSLILLCGLVGGAQSQKKVSIDDLMALRTINDVKIAPAGDHVAYTVSTPSVPRNAHEAALFVIPASAARRNTCRDLPNLCARFAGASCAMAAGWQRLAAGRGEDGPASPQHQA